MAKKVVATLQKKGEGKMFAKLIKMVKNPETGNYNFKEGIVHPLAAFKYVYLSPLKTGQRKFIPAGKPGCMIFQPSSYLLPNAIGRFPNSPHFTMYTLTENNMNIRT